MAVSSQLYETDTAAWAAVNAELLRERRFSEVDVSHLIEELEDMGKSERRALEGHLSALLMHLLKWEHQASMRSNGWKLSIENARQSIADSIEDSPSLQLKLEDDGFIARAYTKARRTAAIETGLELSVFPEQCPTVLKQSVQDPARFLLHI